MLEKLNPSNHLKLVITTAVNAACSSLTALSQLSEVDKFYWHFIALCCNLVQPNSENLSKLNNYVFVTEILSKIYHDYCTTRKIKKSVIHEVPQEIDHNSNTDVKDYFKWIIKMQNIMIHWEAKFFEQHFNYDDIFMYDGSLRSIAAFAKAVCTDDRLCTESNITKFKDDYSKTYTNLCLLLVKSYKECGW